MQRIRHELRHIVERQRGEHDVTHGGPGLADGLHGPHERVRRAHLVVAIGADEQEMLDVGVGHDVFEQLERRRVQPLEVVEEERERMFLAREHAEEGSEHEVEAALRFGRRKLRHRHLLAQHQLELRDQIDDELTVRTDSFTDLFSPAVDLGVAGAQHLADERLEGLGDRGIRDVALVLIELARNEDAARQDDRPVQLVHDRGLADARIPGHEHEVRCAGGDDLIEGIEQDLALALAPVQLLRHEKPVGAIARAEGKLVDAPARLPFRQASPKVHLQPGGGLIAILRGLREQFQNDRGERRGERRDSLARGHRLPRDVTVHPLHRIGRRERQGAGGQLIQGHAQGVKIAAGVDRSVHAAGLLRGHVGERAGDKLRRVGRLALARQPRGDAETHEPCLPGRGVYEDVGRLDVLVDEAAAVHLAQCGRQTRTHAQNLAGVHRRACASNERFAAGILEHERGPPAMRRQRQGSNRPRRIQLVPQRVFVLQHPYDLWSRMLRPRRQDERRTRRRSYVSVASWLRQRTKSPSSSRGWRRSGERSTAEASMSPAFHAHTLSRRRYRRHRSSATVTSGAPPRRAAK